MDLMHVTSHPPKRDLPEAAIGQTNLWTEQQRDPERAGFIRRIKGERWIIGAFQNFHNRVRSRIHRTRKLLRVLAMTLVATEKNPPLRKNSTEGADSNSGKEATDMDSRVDRKS
ncbi:hypothetical protein AVEN_98937-1 [Araneus ventricosus]|uniref:Uncharacterized protein n=1 Tax=Araneus ventricosus TaxID=182803 RepID=A0A4Y2F417_ARAVE|nr:hypothetical protein AVEN_98937-1 [Araneus ventricosus]